MIIYITKDALSIFGKLIFKNSTVKCAYCGEILRWVTAWEVYREACERA